MVEVTEEADLMLKWEMFKEDKVVGLGLVSMSPARSSKKEKRRVNLVGEGFTGVRDGIWKRMTGIESRE